jgi:hypothetical protein
MKRTLNNIAAALIPLLVLLHVSCAVPQSKEYTQGNHIWYYPGADTYFDEENKVYLLFDTVAQQWQPVEILADAQRNALPANPVLIPQPAVPVYRDIEKHRLLYSTLPYIIPGELARKRQEDSIALQPRKTQPVPAGTEIRKTKIGRWLQKIFGKKEKSAS